MSKELKAKVTLDVKSATAKLDALAKKINAIDKKFSKTATNTSKVSKQVEKAVSATNRAKAATDKWANSTKKVESGVKKTSSAIDEAGRKLKGFLAAFTGVMALRVIINTSDTITSAENRLNALPEGLQNNTQESLDKMYAAAQRSRTGYADIMGNVSKSMTLAPDAFQGNIDNAIRFQEIMGKTYALGGASAAEQSSSMYQMIQALGAGILQGDELRSVREGAPLAYQAIEKFAQGIYGAEENLKDLASEGKITSDIVVAAMMSMGDEIDAKFEDTAMTFAQAWETMKNTAVKSFEPVLQQLNALLNSDAGKAAIEGISNALIILAHIAGVVVDVFAWLFNFMYENWSWMQYIVYAFGLVVVSVLGIITAHMTASAISWIISIVSVHAAFLGWVIVIGIIVAALVWLTTVTGSLCETIVQLALWVAQAIIAVLMVVLVVYLATGTIMLSIPTLIALAIIAVLLVLLAAFLTWTGQIVGFFYGLGSAASAVFNNIKLAFSNILDTMKYLFWKWVDGLLTNFKPLINAFNVILSALGKDTIDVNFAANKAEEYASKIGFENVGDAFHEGYANGFAVGEGIQDKINGFGDKIKNFSLTDSIANSINGGGLPDPTAPAYDVSGSYDPSKVLKGIKGDTGDIKDSVDLTTEDLEYLRKVADMEWKKEFTTASITVDMSNYNTINGDNDLDGIVTRLSDRLYEELDAVANGVYA